MVTRLILLVIVSKFSLFKQDTLTLVGNQFRKTTTLASKLDKSIIKPLHSLLTRTIIFPNNAGIKGKKTLENHDHYCLKEHGIAGEGSNLHLGFVFS